MCSRFGTVTRYTNDIRPFHQSLLPCSIIVVWDEAPLKEPIRFLALHKLISVQLACLSLASSEASAPLAEYFAGACVATLFSRSI